MITEKNRGQTITALAHLVAQQKLCLHYIKPGLRKKVERRMLETMGVSKPERASHRVFRPIDTSSIN